MLLVVVIIVLLLVALILCRKQFSTTDATGFAIVGAEAINAEFLDSKVTFYIEETVENLQDAKELASSINQSIDLPTSPFNYGYLPGGMTYVGHPFMFLYNDSEDLVDVVLLHGDTARPVIIEPRKVLCVPFGFAVDNVMDRRLYRIDLRNLISMIKPI